MPDLGNTNNWLIDLGDILSACVAIALFVLSKYLARASADLRRLEQDYKERVQTVDRRHQELEQLVDAIDARVVGCQMSHARESGTLDRLERTVERLFQIVDQLSNTLAALEAKMDVLFSDRNHQGGHS